MSSSLREVGKLTVGTWFLHDQRAGVTWGPNKAQCTLLDGETIDAATLVTVFNSIIWTSIGSLYEGTDPPHLSMCTNNRMIFHRSSGGKGIVNLSTGEAIPLAQDFVNPIVFQYYREWSLSYESDGGKIVEIYRTPSPSP